MCSGRRRGRPTVEGPERSSLFAIGGKAPPPNFTKYQMAGSLEGVKHDLRLHRSEAGGALLYVSNCVFCHGVPGVDKGATSRTPATSRPRRLRT